MTLADKARACADAAPLHQSAAVLRECADEIDRLRADLASATEWANAFAGGAEKIRDMSGETVRLRADLAALRAVVRGLPEYEHHPWCIAEAPDKYAGECECGTDAANAALAAAKKMAGEP